MWTPTERSAFIVALIIGLAVGWGFGADHGSEGREDVIFDSCTSIMRWDFGMSPIGAIEKCYEIIELDGRRW